MRLNDRKQDAPNDIGEAVLPPLGVHGVERNITDERVHVWVEFLVDWK